MMKSLRLGACRGDACKKAVEGLAILVSRPSYLGVGAQISKESAKRAIEKIFTHTIIGHNLKFDLLVVYGNFGLPAPKTLRDSMVLGWLIDSASMVGLDEMMERFFCMIFVL